MRTIVLNDVRGDGRCLRVTWHPDTGTLVFSHWHGGVCSASTPVHLVDATKVVELVARSLRDAVERQANVPQPTSSARRDWFEKVRRVARPSLARVIRLWRRADPSVAERAEQSGDDESFSIGTSTPPFGATVASTRPGRLQGHQEPPGGADITQVI